ncbi:MAG TPA: DNA polymerase I [Acidobacteriaceae bacterium]|jgi:DNA polymerase-1|nr:DNA polymerase I [Acidobacteriaceae bacterium]
MMPATESPKPTIFLLDTMAFIFRAYHAMQRQRPMSTRTGIPTAAVYVFVNMLNKLRKDFSPEYLAAVFDVSAPLLRDEQAKALTTIRKFNIKTQTFDAVEYAGYKANREAMPQDLVQQLPYIRRALDALRIPMLQYEGYEADDVIGTLAKEAAAAGHPVYIVSSDKDMMQLVNEQVRVLNPAKDNLVLDRAGVVAALGVEPEKVIDVMALRGDAIDNVPGAPGIGDKGSVELIQQYGSVESALDHASEVKRKTYRESLENNRDTILLSKELVTIHTSVPVPLDLQQMQTQPPDATACRELFSELEFTSMLKELGASASVPQAQQTEYVLDPSAADVEALLTAAQTQGLSVFYTAQDAASSKDEETEESEEAPQNLSLLDVVERKEKTAQAAQMLVGVAADASKGLQASLENTRVRTALEDAVLPKSVHDLKSLMRAMQQQGVALAGVRDDLMLYSYLVNPTHGSHRLEDVVARFGSQPLSREPENLLPATAAAIAQLAPVLRKDLEAAKTLEIYETMDLPLVPVLLRMEDAGIRIDRTFLETMSSRLNVSLHALGEQIFEQAGHRFNINSPKQLGDVLFNKMNLPKPMKYGRGKVVSTAQDVLEELSEHHAVPRLVLEYRQLAKLKSNYTDSLPLLADAQGRVHTTFNQAGTATGRLSSNNPNVQNIPVRSELGREIRAAFVPAPGNILLSADYSQIELRLMAHFSDDPLLLKAYREDADIHTLTASEVFGVAPEKMDKETRNRAKAVNFGIVYGISPFGLAQQLGIEQSEAQLYIQKYFERYQGVRVFIDRTIEEVRRDQSVRTLFGRIRPIPDISSRNANQRGFAERTAINTPLQGTAADIIKLAMIRIDREMREKQMRSQMVLQVHDELVFDVAPQELEALASLVREAMEHVIELKVPVVATIASGPNWRDLNQVHA